MAIILAILFIALGLGCIFARDFLWKLQDYSTRSVGIVDSQRTPEWELGVTIVGLISMVIGMIIILIYI